MKHLILQDTLTFPSKKIVHGVRSLLDMTYTTASFTLNDQPSCSFRVTLSEYRSPAFIIHKWNHHQTKFPLHAN